MWEVESEFGAYTGDCVWEAVRGGSHHLAPSRYPMPDYPALNALTKSAIDAGIGVGPRGEATPGQLKTMLGRWNMRYSIGYDYNGVSIPAATLQSLLVSALRRGRPVLLGFTNGQALPGDEAHLQGHEVAVIHDLGGGLFGCDDGDNPLCAHGSLAIYTLTELVAAQADSAYILEEVPGSMLQIAETGGLYIDKGGDVWHCTDPQYPYDVQHGVLDYFRELAAVAGITHLARPAENLRTLDGVNGVYEQNFDQYTIHFDGRLSPQAYLIRVNRGASIDVAGIRANAQAILQKVGP